MVRPEGESLRRKASCGGGGGVKRIKSVDYFGGKVLGSWEEGVCVRGSMMEGVGEGKSS